MGGVIWNIFKNSEKDGEKIKSDGEQVKLKRARENAKKRGREEEERERERERWKREWRWCGEKATLHCSPPRRTTATASTLLRTTMAGSLSALFKQWNDVLRPMPPVIGWKKLPG